MKTAMQELIDYLQEQLDDDFDSRTKYIQEFCQKSLEKEKQQIIDSFDNGQANYTLPKDFETGKDYYNETFKNK